MTLSSKWNIARQRHWLRACAHSGRDLNLISRPMIMVYGGRMVVGDRFYLASRPVQSHLVAGPEACLEIGNDVSIGCGAAIAAYQHIRIGDGTQIGPFAIIMDTNFHGSSNDQSVQHDTRPVTIEAGCRIGSRVTITRGVTIGAGTEVLAGSVVISSLPPGVCAAGARARIIGRAGDRATRWESAAAALPEMLMACLELDSAPNLDSTEIPVEHWTDARIHTLLAAIKTGFGTELEFAAVGRLKTFADIADAVRSS
jgi:acetyltransferase-like isoleucine patch superfamily enzyme